MWFGWSYIENVGCDELIYRTCLVLSWMLITLFSQWLKWVLMNWSILGKSWFLIKVGLMIESNVPLMYLWVEPWTAAMLHFPKISNMDWGYPGTNPFASFINMYLFSSGSIDTIVGHPNICDLNIFPYLCHSHQNNTHHQQKDQTMMMNKNMWTCYVFFYLDLWFIIKLGPCLRNSVVSPKTGHPIVPWGKPFLLYLTSFHLRRAEKKQNTKKKARIAMKIAIGKVENLVVVIELETN